MDCFTSFKKLVSFTKIKNQLYKVSHTKPPLPLFFFALFVLFNFFAFLVKTYDTFDLFFFFGIYVNTKCFSQRNGVMVQI